MLHQSAAYVVGTDPNKLPHCATSATGAAGQVAPVGEDCSFRGDQFSRPSSGCFRPALVAGLGISGFWLRQAPCGTPRSVRWSISLQHPSASIQGLIDVDRGELGVPRWRRGPRRGQEDRDARRTSRMAARLAPRCVVGCGWRGYGRCGGGAQAGLRHVTTPSLRQKT